MTLARMRAYRKLRSNRAAFEACETSLEFGDAAVAFDDGEMIGGDRRGIDEPCEHVDFRSQQRRSIAMESIHHDSKHVTTNDDR